MSVSIRHGVNSITLDSAAGKTIGDVRNQVAELLNVPDSAQVRLNNAPSHNEAMIPDHSTVEFVKTAGEKGAA